MTNTIAIALAVILAVAIGLDYALFDAENLLFLGKKFFVLLDWLAFWH